MEHTWSSECRQGGGEDRTYDLEARLATAERRYAQARELSRKARDECQALEAEQDTREGMIRQARARYDKAESKCKTLRRLIEDLEDELG